MAPAGPLAIAEIAADELDRLSRIKGVLQLALEDRSRKAGLPDDCLQRPDP